MARRQIVLLLAFGLIVGAARLEAADRVKLKAGNQSVGTVTQVSPTQVVVELGATKREHAVNEIESITFDDEPNNLTQARFAVDTGRYDDALELLGKINTRDVKRSVIAADVGFYKAIAAARQALAGQGSIADAGRQLVTFERANKDSYHYFEVCATLGDLLAAVGRAGQAESYYDRLAAAPWPEYKMRAAVLAGRALVAQKKFPEAIAKFDAALASESSDKLPQREKLAALLGKASAMAGTGKTDEAVASTEQIIAEADPEDQELHARAYNVLGNCHTAAGKKKEALIAFLHVDLLYSQFPNQHAEALANLADLWNDVDKADRAAQAKALLKEKYPNSTWAQN